jgi:DNA (cytosine-5)-methyltransferase 1
MFDWKWYLKDIRQDKDVKVFSTFSCGGGSTMGYKRAGFKVLGNVEIDPRMNSVYVKNNHPKYNFLMDLREFNEKNDLPDELYNLDILDGSPPCSTFSTAGSREKAWGKEKVFREGQQKQTLDDLFFVFLDTVEKLKPKIVIAENVAGLIKGNAKGYVNQIIKRFKELGYEVQLFKLNAAYMNVPQARERVFFIANNQKYPKLKFAFNEKPILFGEVRTEKGKPIQGEITKKRLKHLQRGDMCISDITKRTENGREVCFNNKIIWDDMVSLTITANGSFTRACDKSGFTEEDYRNVSSFPQDYDFMNQSAQYIGGMSVPPNMMANIATEIYKQWISKTVK